MRTLVRWCEFYLETGGIRVNGRAKDTCKLSTGTNGLIYRKLEGFSSCPPGGEEGDAFLAPCQATERILLCPGTDMCSSGIGIEW